MGLATRTRHRLSWTTPRPNKRCLPLNSASITLRSGTSPLDSNLSVVQVRRTFTEPDQTCCNRFVQPDAGRHQRARPTASAVDPQVIAVSALALAQPVAVSRCTAAQHAFCLQSKGIKSAGQAPPPRPIIPEINRWAFGSRSAPDAAPMLRPGRGCLRPRLPRRIRRSVKGRFEAVRVRIVLGEKRPSYSAPAHPSVEARRRSSAARHRDG